MAKREFYLSINGKAIKVSEEIYREYMRFERKERYLTKDLKEEKILIDGDTKAVKIIPSREDSYERLLENNQQFSAPDKSPEEQLIHALLLSQLEEALHKLSTDELALLYALFYEGKTESQIGKGLNVSQAAVSKNKTKILKKLRKFFEKFS